MLCDSGIDVVAIPSRYAPRIADVTPPAILPPGGPERRILHVLMPTPAEVRVTPRDGTALRIAHVSDIHVGAHDELTLDGLAQDLHDAEVAATIVTGDLTMRARTHEFVRAKQIIDQFPRPTMIVIGNHDVPLTNPMHRMASPYGKYRAEVTENLDPVLDLGTVRIQGLGSMPRWRWKSGASRAAVPGHPRHLRRLTAGHRPGGGDAPPAELGRTWSPWPAVTGSSRPWWRRRSTSCWPGTPTCRRCRSSTVGAGTRIPLDHRGRGGHGHEQPHPRRRAVWSLLEITLRDAGS